LALAHVRLLLQQAEHLEMKVFFDQ